MQVSFFLGTIEGSADIPILFASAGSSSCRPSPNMDSLVLVKNMMDYKYACFININIFNFIKKYSNKKISSLKMKSKTNNHSLVTFLIK